MKELEPELELVFFDGTVSRELETVEKVRLPERSTAVVWLEK